jgi:2-oxoglutarate ferredoxin oxidoreductase subunit alpha
MENRKLKMKNDVSIVLTGQAGMGVQTVEQLLMQMFRLAGFHVFATKEYMSRVRGGMNSTSIRVGAGPVRACVDCIDILVPLNKGGIRHVQSRLSKDTLIIAEKENFEDRSDIGQLNLVDVPFTKIATDLGNKIYSSVVAVGLLAALFEVEVSILTDFISKRFASKDATVVSGNLAAAQAGCDLGKKLAAEKGLNFHLLPDPEVKDRMLVGGAEAIGLGAIAGGCNFIGAYPMSPSTNLLQFLAKHADQFGIVVEQAEDEIAGINMALGAWYAGAKAVASTSGGGFALMTEGLSLCGMIESPLVMHIAQRPGPATGLPTRTEQGDLELALYAGHGEFPRAILAPGNLEEGFDLMRRAFDMADKTQSPIFVLTDQYFVDTYYTIDRPDVSDLSTEHRFVKTDKDYKRFAFTKTGLSPRGIPGFGEGLVVVDSDEHDEEGHITEDLDLRVKMVDKRLGKLKLLERATIKPTLWPAKNDYKTLVICWGSTRTVVEEALTRLGRKDIAMLHFAQVWPVHPKVAEYTNRAKKVICLEGNATGQFAKLLRLQKDIAIDKQILKYNGLQFSVEEVMEHLTGNAHGFASNNRRST